MNSNVLIPPVQEEQFNQEVGTTSQATACLDSVNTKEEAQCEVAEPTEKNEKQVEGLDSETKEQLLEQLEKAIEEKPIEDLKQITETIKIAFYKRNKADVEIAKKAFVENGGDEQEFKLEPDSCEDKLKSLLASYREKRNEATAIIEQQKATNLTAKQELIEKLKQLVVLSETTNENTYNDFTNIQKQWREIGAVPKESLNTIWNEFHFQVESYYNIMKISRELRDLDLKRNLEEKIILCQEAERLSILQSFVEALRELQVLHDKWREIGPVAREQKDEIWDRFKQASTIINKNHQQYFETLNAEQERNLNIKKELCEKAQTILDTEPATRKDWDSQTEEIINIQNIWKTIGFAPKKDNTRIYTQFRELCNKFFEKKQNYFKALREKFEGSLQVKIEISKQVQLLKDSTDWSATTNEIISLQKQWKEAGSVSSKESDQVWQEFRAACDHFFANKAEHYKKTKEGFSDKITAKELIIEELKSFSEENPHTAIEKLKEVQKRWSESGYLPAKIQNPLYAKYKEIIDEKFTAFKKDLTQLNMDNFKSNVSNKFSKTDMYRDRERLQRKLQKLETDVNTLENNIGFFSKSSNAESLIKDIEQKIAQSREEITVTKEKLKHIIKEENNRA